jgi:integrase
MAKTIEQNVYPLKPSKTLPGGYRVSVQLQDQWGDRRKLNERFRAADESEAAYEVALRKARERRDEINKGRNEISWLRKEFPDPVEKKGFTGFDSMVSHHARFQETDKSGQTLADFVERGLRADKQGRYSIDPMKDVRGFLRTKMEDTGSKNVSQKVGIWNVIKREWGGVHGKRLDQITGVDVDDFVRWMESKKRDDGEPHYSKSSIRRYRMTLRSMIKHFAAHVGVVNPLDIKPTQKKPARVKGRHKTRKVPTHAEMKALEKAFAARITEAKTRKGYKRHLPRRSLTYQAHRVMKRSGMRPSELMYLETSHVDTIGKRIVIEGGAVDGEAGLTKTGKSLGDREAGTRVIPVEGEVIEAIQEWLEIRPELGFPDLRDCPVIFCDESGDYLTDDSLRAHYEHTSKIAKLDPGVTPYQMRHWRNDVLRRKGMPIEIRRELIGHLEDETNMNYTNPQAEEARKWFDD